MRITTYLLGMLATLLVIAPTPIPAAAAMGTGSSGRTIHVSAAAPPGGDGSAARPFSTIQAGIEVARAGDTVAVARGTYREQLRAVRSGRLGSPIRIEGADGARIVGGGGGRLIEIHRSFIVVRGFEISGADILVWIQHAHRVRIVDDVLHDAGSECIRLTYLATDNAVARNRISRCGREDFDPAGGSKNGEGVYIGTAPEQLDQNPTSIRDASDRNRVVGNRFQVPAECVDVKEGSRGTLVAHNVCVGGLDPDGAGFSSRGRRTRFVGNVSRDMAGAGIRLGGDEATDGIRNRVIGNVLRDNAGYAVKIMRTPQGAICGNALRNNGDGPTNDPGYRPGRACPGA